MDYTQLIFDFNLYLFETFGYRDACKVEENMNGICIKIRKKEIDAYIRFWEYSYGVGNFPDWCIIIRHCKFKTRHAKRLKDLARFFKEYTPSYGYKHLAIEDDEQGNAPLLGLKKIFKSYYHCNYALPLEELKV